MGEVPTILLIDDEEALLRLMQIYLDRMGYNVYACGTSADAMRMLADQSHQIHLAVADLSLLQSPSALVEMADQFPDVRVLVCSGLPFEVGVLPERVRPRFGSLQKPFLPNMLSEAIDELLQREPKTS